MNNSKYIRTKRTPLPNRKRVRKLVGSFEDNGKYFKCWVCGAINSIDRNIGFDGYGTSAVDSIEEYPPFPSVSGSMESFQITLDNLNMIGTMIKLGLDGNPIVDYYTPRSPQVVFGCWSCGSTNIY